MAIQHANRGIVKKDLQLYYNREWVKSFRGEATTNTCNLNSRYDYVWANGVVTRDTVAPSPPPITGFEIAKLRSTDGADTQTILYTAAVDQVNGGVYTHSAYIYLESGTWVTVGQHWNPWDYGVQTYIPLNKWTRVSYTVTNTPNNYGNVACSYNTNGTIYITATQYEKKSYSTPFVNGSRTANTVAGGGGLLDISGNNINADLTNVSFDSSGYIFAGSQYVNVSSLITGNQSFSWGAWIYPTATGTPVFFGNASAGLAMVSYWDSANNKVRVGTWGFDRLTSGTTILPSNWGYTFWTWDGTTLTSYTNGIADGTATGFSFNISNLYTTIGNAVNAQYFTGRIAQTLVYNRALSAAEVLQNFNATRKTYGL